MKWRLVYFDDQIINIECMKALLVEKFQVEGCNDVTTCNDVVKEINPHLILLDVHMPIIDGHTLYQTIVENPSYNGCPIIFISGDLSDENKIKSYEKGAVDFLPRDLAAEEIIARLSNKVKLFLNVSSKLELGNLTVDVGNMKATVKDQLSDLTLLELRLLSYILRVFPDSMTRQELILRVWGTDSVKPGTINTHLTNLKPKIENWDYQIKVRDENVTLSKKNQ